MTPKLYKAAEVCDMTDVQPYVLRSWEKEFPGIGVQRSPDTPRLYRQSDIEQVRRIRQLVFGEGLTLSGARRRLELSAPAVAEAREDETAEVLDTLGADARARIAVVRSGLRSILDVLSRTAGTLAVPELTLVAPAATGRAKLRTVPSKRSVGTKRGVVAGKSAARVAKRKRASA